MAANGRQTVPVQDHISFVKDELTESPGHRRMGIRDVMETHSGDSDVVCILHGLKDVKRTGSSLRLRILSEGCVAMGMG